MLYLMFYGNIYKKNISKGFRAKFVQSAAGRRFPSILSPLLLLDMIHPLAILIVVSPECCIALVEGFIYYKLCIYMVLELSTSYELIIICFSKRPVPSAKKKTDVTGIFAGCQNQNFSRCVRRNKAC